MFYFHSKVPLKPHGLYYQTKLFSLTLKKKNWFRLKVIKSGQNQLSLADAESCIQKAVFAAGLTDALSLGPS